MTEATTPEVTDPAHTIEAVTFDETYIDHPFIPSRAPADVKAFLNAFAQAQRHYTPVVRDKLVRIAPRDKPAYTFKYAELANVIDAVKALHDEGISVSQPLHEDRQGITWLYTIMAHAEGAGRVTRIKLGGAEELKAFGGIITYLRRYCLAPAVGVASEDDADEDGGDPPDEDGFRRESQQQPAQRATAKPAPQRRAPAAAPADGKDATTVAKPTTGAMKNLQGKIEALKLVPEDVVDMYRNLEVPEDPNAWTLAHWTAVRGEVDRRMAS